MRVSFTAIGTAGDVYPFIALGRTLIGRNHEVTICSYKLHEAKCVAAGVRFKAVAPDIGKDKLNGEADPALRRKSNMLTQIRFLVDMFLLDAKKRYQDCLEATKGADLVVCHHMDFPGQLAAAKNGIPWVIVGYCPFVAPNEDWAPHYERLLDFGPFLNRRLWLVATWVQDKFLFKRLAAFCAELGQPRKGHWTWMPSPYLNIIAASRTVARVPKQLAPNTIISGAWGLREPPIEHSALAAFLAKGTAPVVVSFGSMGSNDAETTTTTLVTAIRGAGLRAIIQRGWANLRHNDAGDDVLFVDYVPHDQLFRSARCVIHHGGAGTSLSATCAGVPSLVVAHGADQFYWGQCLQQLGVAPAPLRRTDMTVPRLRKRLAAIVGSPEMSARASAAAQAIAAEDGLTVAAEALERLVSARASVRS